MKFCHKCLKDKSTGSFNKNKSAKDGLTYWCKKCRKKVHSDNQRKIKMAIEVLKTFEEEYPVEYKRVIEKINKRNTERNLE